MNLQEFIEQSKQDSNLFFKLQSGEIQNLLDEAIEKIEEMQFKVQYNIRREVLNCAMQQWEIIDNLDLSHITVLEFYDKVGLCGFFTAKRNPQEIEFSDLLYELNRNMKSKRK